jgi:hypothetical protein
MSLREWGFFASLLVFAFAQVLTLLVSVPALIYVVYREIRSFTGKSTQVKKSDVRSCQPDEIVRKILQKIVVSETLHQIMLQDLLRSYMHYILNTNL